MFVANNLWPPVVTDQLCVTVTPYSVSDEHLYYKWQHYQEPTATADIMNIDQTLETDAQMSDYNTTAGRTDANNISSPEQTIKDLQHEIWRLKRQVPYVDFCIFYLRQVNVVKLGGDSAIIGCVCVCLSVCAHRGLRVGS